MNHKESSKIKHRFNISRLSPKLLPGVLLMGSWCLVSLATSCSSASSEATQKSRDSVAAAIKVQAQKDSALAEAVRNIDTTLYNQKLRRLANGDSSGRWPVKAPYPNAGAIFPYKRIVAYYGNFYSKRMGVLGEY